MDLPVLHFSRRSRVPDEKLLDLLLLADPDRDAVLRHVAAGECHVATLPDGRIAAAGVLLPDGPQRVELMNIAVPPALQGNGYGAALLQHLIAEARARGFERMRVGTGNSSLGPLAFYQKAGFRIIGVIPDHFTRNYPEPIVENGIPCRDMIRLERDLTD